MQKRDANGRFAKKTKIAIGQFYQVSQHYSHPYILARVSDDGVGLISLKNGNRWTNPVKVEKDFDISPSEFKAILADDKYMTVTAELLDADEVLGTRVF